MACLHHAEVAVWDDEREWVPMYRAGAVSAGIALVLHLMAFVLVFVTDTPPTDPTGAEMLAFVDARSAVYIIISPFPWLVLGQFLVIA